MKAEIINENMSDRVTEEDIPTDTARGSKDEETVEKKGPKSS